MSDTQEHLAEQPSAFNTDSHRLQKKHNLSSTERVRVTVLWLPWVFQL